MVRTGAEPTDPAQARAVEPDEAAGPGLVETWLELLRRRWRVGLGIALALTLLTGAVVFLTRPVYRAEARLRLGAPPQLGGLTPGSGLFGLFRMGGDPFANDLELITSRTVAEGVVDDIALNVRLGAPRGWHRDSLLHRLSTDRATDEATFVAEWRDGGIAVRRTAPTDSAVATVAPGESVAFGGVNAAFRAWREGMPERIELRTVPFAEAVRRARSSIEAEPTRREADVVEIAYQHTDPAVTQAVVASTVEHFIALRTALHRRESGQTADSLRVVVDQTLAELERAEARMEEVQREAGLISPEVQGEVFVERYAEVATELETARAERAGVAALLARVEGAATPAEAWSGLAAFPAFLQNPTVAQQLGQLTQLQARRAALAERRAPESRALRAIDAEIGSLDGTLRSLAQSYHDALDEQVRDLSARLEEMDAQLLAFPGDALALSREQRRTRILAEVLGLTEQRLRVEELRDALAVSNIQPVDPPALHDRPVWPRKKLGTAVGLMLAAGFALLGMVVVDRADRSIRRASDVRAILGEPVLAVAVTRRGRAGGAAADRGRAGAHLSERAARAVMGGMSHVVLAPVSADVPAADIALGLRAALAAEAAEREDAAAPEALVTIAPPLEDYPAAVEADAEAAPIVVLVAHGRTRRAELRRAAELLDQAGGMVAGALVVCGRARDAERVWT